MYDHLDFIIADPSGNITILVLTPVNRQDYASVTRQLLSNKKFNAEQVAFILPDSSAEYPSMEMCGLEFCGNASRSFALYNALSSHPPLNEITVKVSGCDTPLHARIDFADNGNPAKYTGNVEMEMPMPIYIKHFTANELSLNKNSTLVCFDGIAHLILPDTAPMTETFETLKHYFYENYDKNLPAFGVMFYDTVNQMMTPVVYVKDVDTTYFEGSCASGTVAATYALVATLEDGEHNLTMQQPSGTLNTRTIKKNNCIEKIYLSGQIQLSDIMHIPIIPSK